MTNARSDYRLSTRAVVIIGSLCTVLGLVGWIVGAAVAPALAILGFVVFVIGVPVLVAGLVRESREKRAR